VKKRKEEENGSKELVVNRIRRGEKVFMNLEQDRVCRPRIQDRGRWGADVYWEKHERDQIIGERKVAGKRRKRTYGRILAGDKVSYLLKHNKGEKGRGKPAREGSAGKGAQKGLHTRKVGDRKERRAG